MLVELSEGRAAARPQYGEADAYPAPLRHIRPGAQTPQQPVARPPPARRTLLARQPHVQRWAGAAAAGPALSPSASPRVPDLGAAATWRDRQAGCEESGGRSCGRRRAPRDARRRARRRFAGLALPVPPRHAAGARRSADGSSISQTQMAAEHHTAGRVNEPLQQVIDQVELCETRQDGEEREWRRAQAWEQRHACHCRRQGGVAHRRRSGAVGWGTEGGTTK